jgi:hypothetical protein
MHSNKLIAESNNKVKTVWKIVKKEIGRRSANAVCTPIKINDNIVKDPKHRDNFFNTYFLTSAERMNISDTTTPCEDTMKFSTEAISILFPNINLCLLCQMRLEI